MWWRKTADSPQRILRCSFCQKLQDKVPQLIAGPSVFICSECVAVCNDILADNARVERQQGAPHRKGGGDAPAPWPQAIACSLCHSALPADGAVVIERRGAVCAACFDAMKREVARRA